MILQILSVIICLWLSKRIRQAGSGNGNGWKQSPWSLARSSLKTGMLAVTVPLLGYLGVVRYMNGMGMPSPYLFVVCTGLACLVMMGAGVEITGNVIVDSLFLSGLLAGGCFTVVNGLPGAWSKMNWRTLSAWFLACICAAILARAVTWIKEDD